ncbi:MAG TPA: DUF805 domain-containing protein [Thiobacillaceae bacterium]
MNWFLTALKKYAVFSGRSRRSEYWYFVLFYLVIYIALAVIDNMLNAGASFGLLSGIFSLVMLIPSLSVGVRRLHDTDRSGWWLLIGLVPILGAIALIAFAAQDSQPGDNRFGPSPKAA